MKLWATFVSVVMIGSVGVSLSSGQATPAPGAGNAGVQQATQQNGGSPYQGYGSDYPAPEVQAIPMAFAHAVTSRAVQDEMLTELHATVDRMREDFNYSPDMIAATRERNSAFEAYDESRRRVLEKLSQDPNYRAMISLVVSLKHKLEDERPGPKPTEEQLEQLLATATLKLSYASAASAMEVASLSADADVMQNHARLMEAAEKMGVMRSDFERQIRRDPEFLAARHSLDEARISRLTAEAFLSGALDARSVAMDYAYYLHRFDQYSYSPALLGSSIYPYGGYGYGNGGYRRE